MYKLSSNESQFKVDSDAELQSPLKESQNKSQMRIGHSMKLKQISATQPVYQEEQKENLVSQSLTVDCYDKENFSLRKRGSTTQRDQIINSNEEIIPQQLPLTAATTFQQIPYKINIRNKQQLEKIQENDDDKVQSSLQQTSTQQSRDNHQNSNQNKTLKELDGQIKDVLNTHRFKDLSNLLEESKNQLKNDVQEIINGLESDQQLIKSKISDLQEEYNEMKIRKSQNQEVDEDHFIQIEHNLQKQINYLQALRQGLVQSQQNMFNPFIKQEITPFTIENQAKTTQIQQQGRQSKNEQNKSPFSRGSHRDDGNKSESYPMIKDYPTKSTLQRGDNIKQQKVDGGTQTISNQNTISARQPIRGKTAQLLSKQDKSRQYMHNQLQQDQSTSNDKQLPDLYKNNRQQSQNRQEIRKHLEIEEQKLHNLKLSDIDLSKKNDSRPKGISELKQIGTESTTSDSRSKKCLSAMKQNDSRTLQQESNKEILLKRINHRKDFSQTIRGIFHSASKNGISNSPDSINVNNQNSSINDQDKSRYTITNKTQKKLDLSQVNILPRDPLRKRANNNNSFVEQKNRAWNRTPDTSQSEIYKAKRLDYSFNQFTPHKETQSGNQSNHSQSISNQGSSQNNRTRSFLPQQSDSSILKNLNKNSNKFSQKNINNMNSSKDNLNMSIISKGSQNTNRPKKGNFYHNGIVDPFEQTQNSYLYNECSWKSKIDYMDQIKQKFNLKSSPENWRRIANDQDIDNDVKIEQLKQYSQMLGLKAKRKIQLSRIKSNNNQNSFFLNEDLMEADDLIINSIKAKLAIIETANKQYDQQISEQGESLEQSVQNLNISYQSTKHK